MGRAPGLLDLRPRHHLRLPRLQPRGRDPDEVVSQFTYTLETIIQAGKLLVAVEHVPIRTNPKTRESRLFPSMGAYVRRNAVSIFRIYAQYEPLRVFWSLAAVIGVAALGVWIRFVVAYAEGNGKGHVQSLILGAVLFIAADRAVGARRDRRPARRPARDDPAHLRARAPDRAAARRRALPLRARAGRPDAAGARPPASRRAKERAEAPERGARRQDGERRGVTVSRDGVVTGNTFDKYGSTNPFVRRMMAGFERNLDELLGLADPRSLLDVGCGEGVLAQRWAQRLPGRRVVGIDLEEDSIQAGWAEHRRPTSSTA